MVSEGVDGGMRGSGGQSDLPSSLEEMSSQEVQTHSILCMVFIPYVRLHACILWINKLRLTETTNCSRVSLSNSSLSLYVCFIVKRKLAG